MQKLILKILTLILVLFAATFTSCNSKTSYMKRFESFVNSISEKQGTYTDQQWQEADIKFEKFSVTEYARYQTELTKEEKQKIGKLKGKYLAIRAKREMGNLIDNLNDAVEQLGGGIEGFTEEIDTNKKGNF